MQRGHTSNRTKRENEIEKEILRSRIKGETEVSSIKIERIKTEREGEKRTRQRSKIEKDMRLRRLINNENNENKERMKGKEEEGP